jgi:imidazolonepropionase-like amidohydrolase
MLSALAFLAALAAVPTQLPPELDVLIRARVLYVGDGTMKSNAAIGVQGGKIAFVADAPPAGTTAKRTLEIAEAYVTPGFVEGTTHAGLPRGGAENEEGAESTPQWRTSEAIDPRSEEFTRLLDAGVTTAVVVPGSRNVFGGLAVAVKPRGGAVKDMILRDEISSFAVADRDPTAGNSPPGRGFFRSAGPNLYNRRPTTRMGVVFELRRGLQEGAGRLAGGAWSPLYPEPAGAAFARAAKGETPFGFSVGNATDCLAAVRIAEEFGVSKYYLQDAVEAAAVAEKLAQKRVPVLIGAVTFQAFPPSEAARASLAAAPAHLAKLGVTFGISRGTAEDGSTLRDYAIAAARGGLEPAAAIAAITGRPAAIVGLADRVGAVAVGKDADLLIFEGDPLKPSSRLAAVLMDGQVVREAASRK